MVAAIRVQRVHSTYVTFKGGTDSGRDDYHSRVQYNCFDTLRVDVTVGRSHLPFSFRVDVRATRLFRVRGAIFRCHFNRHTNSLKCWLHGHRLYLRINEGP